MTMPRWKRPHTQHDMYLRQLLACSLWCSVVERDLLNLFRNCLGQSGPDSSMQDRIGKQPCR